MSEVGPEDSVSSTGSSSSRISSSSTKARAKEAALKAEAIQLRELHDLQMQELMIQQKKADKEIQIKISAAEAERKVYEEEEKEEETSEYFRLPQLQQGDSHEAQHLSNPTPRREPELVSSSNPMFWQPSERLPTEIFQPLDLNDPEWRRQTQPAINPNTMEQLASQMMQAQDRHSEALLKIVQQQQNSVTALTLPNPSMKVFSGNPADYCEFVTAFRHLVESKTTNVSARLHYLIQYTSGTVQELMRSCLSMSDDRGYPEARRLLKERYGQPYKIAAAHVKQLLEWPVIKAEDGSALQRFSTQLTSCTNTLEEIGYLSKLDNAENLRKIIERLPYRLRVKWREVVDTIIEREKRDVTIKDITKFVTDKARVATHPVFGKLSDPVTKPNNASSKPKQSSYKPSHNYAVHTKSDDKKLNCTLCGDNHWISKCDAFRRMTVNDRWKFIKEKKMCNNCLTIGHFVRSCPKPSFCKIDGCKYKHSTFLHPKEQRSPSINAHVDTQHNNQGQTEVIASGNNVSMTATARSTVATGLAAVPVRVKAPGSSKIVETYAFLDNGSNTTFCTKELLQQLEVKTNKVNLSLTTMNGINQPVECELTRLEIFDLDNRKSVILPNVYSTKSLPISTDTICTQQDINRWPHLKGVRVQKIEANIGLLVGCDVPELLQPLEVRRCQSGGPYATRTILGWVINGPLGKGSEVNHTANFIDVHEDLSKQFKQYCNLEFNDSLYDPKSAMSQNDKRAMKIMENSATLKNGHYEIALPWKTYPPNLKNNKCLAESRLNTLKRRLDNDPVIHKKYQEFMNDLILKGYTQKVQDIDPESQAWYLPHHPVFHPQKPDKIRVVFDCSAKYCGVSLNDQILQGPDLTNTLVGVLMRFRRERIAIMADIESMFYQVRVRPSDCNYLRYLWWPNGDTNTKAIEYQMMVHLFGGVSSPSCANYALKRTAEDNHADFDAITVKTVKENFYVDDCLQSVASESEAKRLVKQLQKLLSKGGFRLTKWISNSIDVLDSIPERERTLSVKDLDLDFENNTLSERALGVRWNLSSDTFGFRIIQKEKPPTRRGMLSITSSIYDPLGFVSPCILTAKAIQQELCAKGLGWDDKIPPNYRNRWEEWLTELPKLEKFSIPRCVKPSNFSNIIRTELHHFSDASTLGYGAVSYLRQINIHGDISCALVMAKSRLSPIKPMTIPRLELSAAVVSTRLDKMIKQEIGIKIDSSTFWTDSTCVLRYIENQDKRFQTFVANRITAILDNTKPCQWRFVDGLLNPADEASRGMSVDEILSNRRWKEGPDFLKKSEKEWPQRPIDLGQIPNNDPEVKTTSTVCTNVEIQDTVSKFIERYSSWTSLRKTTAWILRYKTNLQEAVQRRKVGKSLMFQRKVTPLSVSEINDAELAIVRYIQQQFFGNNPDELRKKTNSLYKLDPILVKGIIRIGGRLHNAPIEDDAKHQIILPKNHHMTKTIIRYYHQLSGHSGLEYTLSLVREKFWPVNGRATVRAVLNECFNCRKRQSPLAQQKMAQLPKDRVTPSKPPFTYVGVDCFGPFEVRRGRSKVKRYGVLFTCLTIRAVHIEIANSLDTESFLNALRRFIARRGQPEKLRSDNGGNFVKGEKELRKSINDWNQSQIHEFLLQRNVQWTFNPPMGSHHGGVWERCIRTVRKVMMAVLKQQTLDDEGLNTLMCEIEAIVNGRPITKLSDDPCDITPLTPNHLLLLRTGNNLPPGKFTKEDTYSRRRWRQVQYMSDIFWRRWTREYLPSLQHRQKWNKMQRNFVANDIVLVLDENAPRGAWPLGRILEVYTNSNDGLVRSVKVKTHTSTLTRPIDKLVLLEEATKSEEKY